MCGIAGVINFNGEEVRESDLRVMMTTMKHRGPDDDGVYIKNNVGFGFVRLSIIDLSPAGHQPFKSEDERYVMVYNGEIFNYIELRDELERFGYNFKTQTDTEVLLKSYIHWGEKMLHKLNGMWALAIYDTIENSVFFARDRYGIKPFYYSLQNGKFIFASEIPSILKLLPKQPSANMEVIFDFLVYNRTEQSEHSFFSEIKKIMHGHYLKINLNDTAPSKIIPKKWYDIRERVKSTQPFINAGEYKDLFNSAIKLRLRSDVPVGVSFSGGLDSSAITSVVIDDFDKEDLNTFSAVYGDSFKGDESFFMNLYKDKPGDRHFIYPTGETLLRDLDSFINCHSEPLPSTSPYAQFKVMELAAQNVVVTLDGQGADEQLGGYHYFFGFYFKDLFKKAQILKLNKEIYAYIKIHKSLFGLKTFLYFLLPEKKRKILKIKDMGYINSEFTTKHGSSSNISSQLYGSVDLQDAMLNHFEYKLEHLLKWEDRNSMHFSLEARVPFLDYRLVEKTLASDSSDIIKNGMTKHILREAMKGKVPEEIRLRVDKTGYTTPQDEWFRTPEWELKITELINSETFESRKIFKVNKVKEMFAQHINREKNIANEIWKWIHLELWFRKYID